MRRGPYIAPGIFAAAFAAPAPRGDGPGFSRPAPRRDAMPPPLFSTPAATPRTAYVAPVALEGKFNPPPLDRDYPLELYQGLDYMREPLSVNAEPWPAMIGAVSGLWPMQDRLSRQFAIARSAAGPWSGRSQPRADQFDQAIFPDLLKVDG